MRPLLVLALAALLAGCASPTPPAEEGPLNVSDKNGLLAVDLATRKVVPLTEARGLAWMSPSATLFVWQEEGFSVIVNDLAGTRDLGPLIAWARVHDNATGLELLPTQARVRGVGNGTALSNHTLPPPPGSGWTAASDDLQVLGAEYPSPRQPSCTNEIFVRGAISIRTQGCHLHVARDGRAAWAEEGRIRVMAKNGTIANVTAGASGEAAQSTYTTHENPVLTDTGYYALRLTGGRELVRTEVLNDKGEVVLTLDGPKRLALVGASDDGGRLLLRVFTR